MQYIGNSPFSWFYELVFSPQVCKAKPRSRSVIRFYIYCFPLCFFICFGSSLDFSVVFTLNAVTTFLPIFSSISLRVLPAIVPTLYKAKKFFCIRYIGKAHFAVLCKHFQTVKICHGFISFCFQSLF